MAFIMNIVLQQSLSGQDVVTTWPVYSSFVSPDLDEQMTDGLDWLENTLLPILNAMQVTQLVNVSATASIVGNSALSQSRLITGGGDVAAADANALPPQLAVYFRQSVGATRLIQGDALYTGDRPIRRGGVFISGLTEDWIDVDGIVIPSAYTTQIAALSAAYVTGFTSNPSGVIYKGCVWSYPRPELPPTPAYPDGRAERPYVYAPVGATLPRSISRLKSRSA